MVPRREASRWWQVARTAVSAVGFGAGAAALLWAFRRQGTTEQDLQLRERIAAEGLEQRKRAAQVAEHDVTERWVAELYTKAVEQLGSDKAAVRLGGLYALEQLAQDNPGHRQTIVNVICAYLRLPGPVDEDLEENQDSASVKSAGGAGSVEEQQAARERARQWAEERQVRQTAQRILTDHLFPDRDEKTGRPTNPKFWPDIDLDLSGATLHKWEFAGCEVRHANFFQTVFRGGALFYGAVFHGDAWFNRATFHGDVEFYGTIFHGYARFHRSVFHGEAAFGGAVFHGDAGFHTAVFRDRAAFSNVAFHAGADFGRAVFRVDANFSDAVFRGITWFEDAVFRGYAWFDEAVFHDSAGFGDAVFHKKGNFRETVFHDEARFVMAVFHGDAWFREVIFHDSVKFDEAVFRDSAWFEDAVFRGIAWFEGAVFHNNVKFEDAAFHDDARFDKAIFYDDVWFDEAVFHKGVQLVKARARLDRKAERVWPVGWQVWEPADDEEGLLEGHEGVWGFLEKVAEEDKPTSSGDGEDDPSEVA